MCENNHLPQASEILDIHRETVSDWTYRLAWNKSPQPGQFFEVSLPGLGEAPISISGIGSDYIDMTIRKVGRVTHGIFELTPGKKLYLRGPLGQGFPLEQFEGRHLVVIAGGTGLAPVKPVINHFIQNRSRLAELDILIGFKSSKDILFRHEIQGWSDVARMQLTVDRSSDDWTGHVGLITELIPQIKVPDIANTVAIVVGPPAMMRHSIAAVIELGLNEHQIFVSYERRMSCGVGKCGHCKINDKYVCVDGPVFNYSQARYLKD